MRIMQKRLVNLDCKSLPDAVYIVNRSLQDKESSDHCDWYEKRGGGGVGGVPALREVVQVSYWQQVYVLDEGT
jgi:hypothetical protein